MKIDVQVDDEAPASADEIRRAIEHTLASEAADLHVSVAVVDDPTIHRVNREHLAHDYPTDVLSFDLRGDDEGVDAELIISHDTASREALARGGDPTSELLLYCVHGVLHLVGYDDSEDSLRQVMMDRQVELLSELGYEVKA